jgi:3-oxoacyl-[acyl-carrier protein] reductase
MLNGKVALVTGASRGIGRAIAEKLAENGAKIVINFNKNRNAALDVQEIIDNYDTESLLYQASVENYEEVEQMLECTIKTFGKIDILVNSAGIARNALFKDMTLEAWHQVIDVNLTGTFNACKAASKYMLEQKSGKIINISSVGGLMAVDSTSNYSPSKAGVMALTRVLGVELIKNNINVNCIAPGLVDTDLLTNDVDDATLEYIASQIPAKRICSPREVADLAMYLCSDASGYVVGQTFVIDGGLSL